MTHQRSVALILKKTKQKKTHTTERIRQRVTTLHTLLLARFCCCSYLIGKKKRTCVVHFATEIQATVGCGGQIFILVVHWFTNYCSPYFFLQALCCSLKYVGPGYILSISLLPLHFFCNHFFACIKISNMLKRTDFSTTGTKVKLKKHSIGFMIVVTL